ncbi:hypothetical protein [Flavobacterium gelatinilyticum]|uniref:hypothetical protein n=1 Tax=Flavobacterium gelatinilyticum TaxID=3003260 RepID=UPI0024801899|nr:hypothetical protein [Flavobacterium gelatinilyticum]
MSLSELQTYPFEYCEVLKANDPDHYFKAVHVYKFNADENRYLVTFEEYQHNLYILHFCLEEHRDNDDKFNVLANIGPAKAKKVIATCVYIGLSIYKRNPLASFVFTASPTIAELNKTDLTETKRLFIYRHFAEFFFNAQDFIHSYSTAQNSYLILNKKYEQQEPEVVLKINDMLKTN